MGQEREGIGTIATLHAIATRQEGASHENRFGVFRPRGSVQGWGGKLLASRAGSCEHMLLNYYQYYKFTNLVHVPAMTRHNRLAESVSRHCIVKIT